MGVRIASPKPPCCSACYNQPVDSRYVDFEAALDGPIVVDERGVARTFEGGTVSVENLILCEACVRAGAELLSIEPSVMEGLRGRLRLAEADAAGWRGKALVLQAAAVEWGESPEPASVDAPAAAEPAPRLKSKVSGRKSACSPDERRAVVERVRSGRASVAGSARELKVSEQTIRNWVAAAREPAHA